MNKHVLGDRLLLTLIGALGKPFFSQQVETAPFAEHLAGISIDLPDLSLDDVLIAVPMEGLAGPMEAGLKVICRSAPDAPVVIYHQGGGEIPFDQTVRAAFPAGRDQGVTVIAVKTPFQTTQQELRERFVDFNNYVAMIASVVRLTEALIQSPDLSGAACKIVAGYSLGGFVSGRHHIHYNSADAYVPFVSGTAHAEIFFTSVKAAAIARKRPEILRSRLNFTEDWARADNSNVFPVLGKYDQLNKLSVQGPSYGGLAYDLWEGGHLYGAKHPHLIREKIQSVIADLRAGEMRT
ncbi:MAG: hypothetical protein MRY64_00215 [Hyphomonadaceae bacterium]|nr:hypothetical protein [Hyphomonadaceae bacterium]